MNINSNKYTENYGSISSDERLKTVEATHLFNGSFIYDTSDLLWETYQITTGGTLTHLPNSCGIRLSTDGTANSKVIRQSKNYFRYTPNKTQKLVVSILFGSTQTGVYKRIGLFDDNNGFYWEHRSDGMYIVRRSKTSGSVVNTREHSRDWNIDKLDGTGPSSLVVDWTKIQLLYIEYMWQGSGCIVFSIQYGKKVHPVHVIQAGNLLTTPHIGRPDLPIRYTIATDDDTTTTADSFDAFSGSVITEGSGEEATSLTFGADSGTTAKSVTARTPLLTIRPKLTYNSITNRGFIEPIKAEVISNNAAVLAEIVINGTITSGVFNSVHANSLAQSDNSGIGITGGITLGKFFVPSGQKECFDRYEFKKNSIPISLDSSGNLQTNLSIVVSALAGGTANVHGLINWKELQ